MFKDKGLKIQKTYIRIRSNLATYIIREIHIRRSTVVIFMIKGCYCVLKGVASVMREFSKISLFVYVHIYVHYIILGDILQYSSSVTLRVLARLERVTYSWLVCHT